MRKEGLLLYNLEEVCLIPLSSRRAPLTSHQIQGTNKRHIVLRIAKFGRLPDLPTNSRSVLEAVSQPNVDVQEPKDLAKDRLSNGEVFFNTIETVK
jgi:hypothetical protein